METEGNKLLEQGGIDLDATLPAFNPEDAAAVIISDDDETSFPTDWPQAISTLKIKLAWGPQVALRGQESMLISSKEASHRRKGGESASS